MKAIITKVTIRITMENEIMKPISNHTKPILCLS